MSTSTAPTVMNAAQKAWLTRRAKAQATGTTAGSIGMSPARKAWATRRANAAKSNTTTPASTPSTPSRTISLDGTRRLRASVPTLVGHLNNAESVEYFYSAGRSIIVLNN